MKTLPYNTGKVLIGKHYAPPKDKALAQPSKDMYDLQSALLGEPRIAGFWDWMTRMTVGFAVVIIFMDLFIWRP